MYGVITQLVSQDSRIQIGVGTYATSEPLMQLFHPNNNITIGKFVSMASSVTIFSGGNHPIDFITTHPLKLFFGISDFSGWTEDCRDGDEVTCIGNDVWLGSGCTILSGASIGDGAIIGAQSVVRGQVPPYAIVIGNPGIVVRYRFSEKIIDKLLVIKWWDWPIEKIRNEIFGLTSNDMISFLDQHS